MIVTIILPGQKPEQKNIPLGWKEVDYETFLKIQGLAVEPLVILSHLWGIPVDILRTARIVNFDAVAAHLNALSYPLDTKVPETILGHKVAKDMNFEEVGRYWDIKKLYDSYIDSERRFIPKFQDYPLIVTAVVMPGYLDATTEQQDEFAKQFLKAPCEEVLAIANFCLTKLAVLRMATVANSNRLSTPKRSWPLAMTSWVRNLVLLIRLKYWNRKLRSRATKSSR